MSPGEPLGGPFGPFAADLVGLEPVSTAADSTAALFRKLRDDDFLPDPLTHEALLALAGRPVGAGSLLAEEAAGAEEQRHLAEVERFAADFFAIPVVERAGRWRALAQSGARHPRSIERLKALRPGLSIDRGAFADPSPPVRRLADDLLDLFPMRPEPRAVESRGRALRFQADETLTDSDRGRALRDLTRGHPDLAAISDGYLDRLEKPPRPASAKRFRAKVADTASRKAEPNRWQYVGITLFLLSVASRLLTNASSTPRPTPSPPILSTQAFPSSAYRPGPNPQTTPNLPLIHRAVRDEIKAKLRGEVAKLGKALDEPTLDRLVGALPVEQLPQAGGMATLVLLGAWTEKVHARFVALLRDGLASTDLDLDEEGRDELARECFPKPVQARGPGSSPGP